MKSLKTFTFITKYDPVRPSFVHRCEIQPTAFQMDLCTYVPNHVHTTHCQCCYCINVGLAMGLQHTLLAPSPPFVPLQNASDPKSAESPKDLPYWMR